MIQLDIKTAFLYGDLDEEIYMEQPKGFITPGRETGVCRLVKSLYGLKQAPRCWNEKFNKFITKLGLTRCLSDFWIYYRHQGEEFTVLTIFVYDGIICSKQKEAMKDILGHLQREFEIRTMPADRFLGLNLFRCRSK